MKGVSDMELKSFAHRSDIPVWDYTKWERVFAWLPCRLQDGRVIWLDYVERSYYEGKNVYGTSNGSLIAQYRDISN